MQIINAPRTLIYDGTPEGFFTVIFEVYNQKINVATIAKKQDYSPTLFDQCLAIDTNIQYGERVLKGVAGKISPQTIKDVLTCFLAEKEAHEMPIFHFLQKVFNNEVADHDYRDEHILAIHQIAQKVRKEAHRMKGFIRFKLSKDNAYIATIEPDHHVLPLLAKHFKARYNDQDWIIFDVRRQKGLFYIDGSLKLLLANEPVHALHEDHFHANEQLFQQMWKEYVKHVNIKERKNERLQKQHMPSRYWKYLVETE